MIAAFFTFFFAVLILNIWMMWRRGEITGIAPATPRERRRLVWVAIGAVNFIVFVLHVVAKGTCAFPAGGNLADGVYLVPSHGRMIPFSPTAYALSYAHGVIAVLIHVASMIAVWRLRQSKETEKPEPSPGAYSSKAADGLTGNAQE